MGTRGRVSAENEEGVGVGHVQGEVRAGAAEAPPQVNCGVSLHCPVDFPLVAPLHFRAHPQSLVHVPVRHFSHFYFLHSLVAHVLGSDNKSVLND